MLSWVGAPKSTSINDVNDVMNLQPWHDDMMRGRWQQLREDGGEGDSLIVGASKSCRKRHLRLLLLLRQSHAVLAVLFLQLLFLFLHLANLASLITQLALTTGQFRTRLEVEHKAEKLAGWFRRGHVGPVQLVAPPSAM